MKRFQTAALVAAVSLCAGAAKADLVQFDIQTSTFAQQLSLNAGGGIDYTNMEVSSVGFSEMFSFAGLMELWSSGVVSDDYGTAIYTTANTLFAPVSALGNGAFSAESLAQNTAGLDLAGQGTIQTFVNFWDNTDPANPDWGNNTINFSISFYGSRDQYQSDVAYINDWFNYSRQYVIQLNGPASAGDVFSYSEADLLATLQNSGGASVSYYEQWTRSSASCVVNDSCTTLSYDGMAYYGWGSYHYQGAAAVDAPTSLSLLLAAPLMFWLRRRRM
ncbi:MAG: hypothetical protein ACK4E7_08995 [Permianibacter sp.]